jgi:hypothetical protein
MTKLNTMLDLTAAATGLELMRALANIRRHPGPAGRRRRDCESRLRRFEELLSNNRLVSGANLLIALNSTMVRRSGGGWARLFACSSSIAKLNEERMRLPVEQRGDAVAASRY